MPIVDLHCHVLPGVDDGPADLAETRALLAEARAVGVETVACTPHMFHPGFRNDDPGPIRERFDDL
ncbi:MAG: CpsB/CapC family capsule biosynthesis tyrosine phosphatase, partial [Thermoanaerobaculia bacterium]|nr:CpsB/CapC family capsule biosynthesis tyrosine phosphatase [Thermoanaerobaculia bacterium]